MATFKHISSKNADYGAAEQYLTFEHDEFTMKPTLDGKSYDCFRQSVWYYGCSVSTFIIVFQCTYLDNDYHGGIGGCIFF